MPTPNAPVNVHVIAKANYNILWWDVVTTDTGGSPIGVSGYRIYNGYYVNESDQAVKVDVTTFNVDGNADTIYVDTNSASIIAYRVTALVGTAPSVVESSKSDKVVAVKSPSQTDTKLELLDRKIMILDEGKLDEGILT